MHFFQHIGSSLVVYNLHVMYFVVWIGYYIIGDSVFVLYTLYIVLYQESKNNWNTNLCASLQYAAQSQDYHSNADNPRVFL